MNTIAIPMIVFITALLKVSAMEYCTSTVRDVGAPVEASKI